MKEKFYNKYKIQNLMKCLLKKHCAIKEYFCYAVHYAKIFFTWRNIKSQNKKF